MLKKLISISGIFYSCLSFAGYHQTVELQMNSGTRIDMPSCVELGFISTDFFNAFEDSITTLSYPKVSKSYSHGPKNIRFFAPTLIGNETTIFKDACYSIFTTNYRTPEEDGKLTVQATVNFIRYMPENRKEFIISNCQLNWQKF